ncbi:putative F-box/FBD/LRR-repeat protein At1g78760 isoform X1 [Tasmannia lanceolata]|uniref:putative F-box/FBD/LRR-repeat protein At1g78760 isoform X1 n=1 Tax=Tasmannia lanceolata TaxID=3420 RepID=UPI0040646AF5
MVETRAYRRLRANEDRISKLPDHLLGSILSLLPMKEASRASILSKRWRYLFTSLPHLVLDYRLSLQIKKWVSIVDHILSLYQHDSIQSCEITYVFFDDCLSHIDRFLSFLIMKGIQRLVLNNTTRLKLYKVPHSVFCCGSLKKLELQNCTLNSVSTFKGLRRLEYLKLNDVEASGYLIADLVSSCNNLKELELFFYFRRLENLEIEIPYLLTLNFFSDSPSVIRLKNAARLVNFSIQITPSNCQRLPSQEDKADKAFHQFLGDIANVKCLQLFYQIGHLCREKVPDNLGYHFPNLRILTMVIDLNNANDTRFFAVLLKGAPCLQNLTVLCDSPICFNLEEKVELDYWKKLEPFYCMRHHLVTIRINFADYNNKQDLGILEFLLMNGSMLKEVRIGYNKHCERWIKTKKKSLLQRRASSHTLLTFACDEQYWF